MRKTIALLAYLLFLSTVMAQSPCPSSTSGGIHVVQKGETLYSVSRKYKVAVPQICEWNNMHEDDILQVCTELKVASNVLVVTAKNIPKTYSSIAVKKQENAPQEEIAEVVTEITSQEVQYDYAGTPNYSYFETSPYLPFYHVVSANETPTTIANLYGLLPSDVMMMNNLNYNAPLAISQKLILEDRRQMRNGTYVFDKDIQPIRAVIPKNDVPKNYSTQTNTPQSYNDYGKTEPFQEMGEPREVEEVQPKSVKQPKQEVKKTEAKPSSKSGTTSMNTEEMDMVNEINLVRGNPAGYIPYIQEYIDNMKKTGSSSAISAASELIGELKNTQKLSILAPLQCVYTAAKKHGDDQKRRGDTDHQGSDGSWPWDRVKRECSDLQDGNENLVGGPASVRKAVILLLVDDGIDTRGHRKTMLNPDWKYIACYKIGTVGSMPNCWVQNFGY